MQIARNRHPHWHYYTVELPSLGILLTRCITFVDANFPKRAIWVHAGIESEFRLVCQSHLPLYQTLLTHSKICLVAGGYLSK